MKKKINNPFEADSVRLTSLDYSGKVALRIELYGCDVI